MGYLQSTAGTAEQARTLLDAWSRGDIDRFQNCLDAKPSLNPSAELPCVEFERRELLDSIIDNLRLASREKTLARAECEVQVSIQLLKHLVSAY
jgi:hypothetical protein